MMPATPAESEPNVSMDLSPREQELARGLFGGLATSLVES